ncbi:O-antigen ligase family protein [Rhodopirellula halodulae]|uniref:O-antigen ligase family protein n=1 Tax=Rhodopirellula halodulae TaxID=2894198 RepID=UPI001E312844|nr:O-antigen ligase family protein [Rhodopirellula sp. JC737]MCC9656624.1 O-antigen ligase family protein [Rhodopirellula sp. JC737]
MSVLRTTLLWISATILVLIPFCLAADFGGILHWSQYPAALGVLAAMVLSLIGLTDSTASSGLRQHKLLLPLGLLVLLAWFQSLTLPSGIVGLLSPGSQTAYSTWLDGLLSSPQQPSSHSISVSPTDTRHVALLLTFLLPLSFAASIVFHARNRLTMLLSAIAITGASVAILGFYRKLDPTADLWFFTSKSNAFAGFVNRNNAALMLNFGMAAGLGLLSWRMMALHSIELDDPDFEFNDLLSLISDRESFIGLLTSITCSAGLLVNGSRGGVVAAIFGLVVAFGYVRPRRGLIGLPILAVVIAISVAILTVPMQLNLETISRLELISANADTLQKDGRLLHWQDGWNAAVSYLPMGSGVSTYGYSYLPYQSQSPGSWFEHADNLWLEMFVETGLPGLVIAVLLFAILLRSLKRLSTSADPIDQGVRVAAWYAIAAVVVSQFFDFGLIMPANLFVAVILATAVVSRQVAGGGLQAPMPDEEDDPYHAMAMADPEYALAMAAEEQALEEAEPIQTKKTGNKIALRSETRLGRLTASIGAGAIAVIVLLVSVLAAPGLKADASSESLVRRIQHEYSGMKFRPEVLEEVESLLKENLAENPTVAAHVQLASTQRDRGRLAETLEWRPVSIEQAGEIYAKTNLNERELDYPPPLAAMTHDRLKSSVHYEDAWNSSLAGLPECPLSQALRATLVELQSVRETQPETAVAVQHLAKFYSTEPMRLMRLGRRAFMIGDYDAAAGILRDSTALRPDLTSRLMPLLRVNQTSLPLQKVIPENSRAIEIAAADVMLWDEPDQEFLQYATQNIQCNAQTNLASRAKCQALLSRIHFSLKQNEAAIKAGEEAIRMEPDEPRYRVQLIEQLLIMGNRPEALRHARMGRQSDPEDQRFQKFIDRIAELDRKEVLEPAIPRDENAPDIESILN